MMRVADIIVEDRYRMDLGDLEPLMRSISTVGLLHPVVVTPDRRLVAGARRLAACARLGWDDIPVTVAESWDSASAALLAERDENTCRKPMTASELAAIGRALEAIYKPAAKERQGSHGAAPGRAANTLVPGNRSVRVREQVGEALGVSGATYQRVQAVARDASDPSLPDDRREAAADALAAMDNGRSIREAYQEYREEHADNGVSQTTGRDLMRGEAHKRRAIELISGINGFARGVAHIDPQRVVASTDDKELAGLVKQLSEALSTLRHFRNSIQEGTTR